MKYLICLIEKGDYIWRIILVKYKNASNRVLMHLQVLIIIMNRIYYLPISLFTNTLMPTVNQQFFLELDGLETWGYLALRLKNNSQKYNLLNV